MVKTISEIFGKPTTQHKLVYDSSTETLEPIYFFLLDLMNDFGLNPEKLSDNFSSSPGSGHFAELGQRKSIMQQQGSKLLGDINLVLRSVLNILYDLKDFKTRLQAYDDLKSKDPQTIKAAKLSLKQIWLDKVDLPQKGQSSIKAMALGQSGFQTLIDAFLASDTTKDAEKLDLNERVKRIIIPRVHEFNSWLESSEIELRKRYEIERTYLKSQVNSLNLYSRWAKPYLRAAAGLESKDKNDPALVTTFNTIILELVLLGKNTLEIDDAAAAGELPSDFKKMSRKFKRKYHSLVLVEFYFRGIPQKVAQQSHFSFGGRAEITFSSYALNDDELEKAKAELKESELGDVLKLIEGATEESIGQLQTEIDYFLGEDSPNPEKKKEEKKSSGSNPFLALTGYYNEKPEKKEKEKNKSDKIEKDNWIEKNHLRPLAKKRAEEIVFKLFDIYKKAHGMPSYV